MQRVQQRTRARLVRSQHGSTVRVLLACSCFRCPPGDRQRPEVERPRKRRRYAQEWETISGGPIEKHGVSSLLALPIGMPEGSDSRVCSSIIDAILIALPCRRWSRSGSRLPTPRSARRRRSARSKTPRPVYGGYARAVTVFKRRWSETLGVGGRSKSPQQHHIQHELVACYLNRLPLVAQMRLDCRCDLGKGDGTVPA